MSDEAYHALERQNRTLRRIVLLLVLLFLGPNLVVAFGAYLFAWHYVVTTLIDGAYFGSVHFFENETDRYLEVGALFLLPFSLVVFVWWHWYAIRSRWAQAPGTPRPGITRLLTYALVLAALLVFIWPPVVMAAALFLMSAFQYTAENGNGMADPQLWISVGVVAVIILGLLFASRSAVRYTQKSMGM